MAEGNPTRFVPSGVDAQTWIGFEARIQERRYKALLDAINTAIAARDGSAARIALEELRELRPAATELPDLAARVALLPVGEPVAAGGAYLWTRGLGAVATFVVGVGLVIGLESARGSAPAVVTPTPAAVVQTAAAADTGATDAPGLTPAAVSDTDATPTAPAAAPVPVATTGEPRREEPVGITPNRRTFREAVDERVDQPSPARGEVSDDDAAAGARGEGRPGYAEALPPASPAIAANIAPRPISITQPPPAAPPVVPAANATTTAAAATPVRNDRARVSQVLNQYARAYGDLNPSAAREVWPSVDEHALTRAFASLESQDVAFDSCSIDVKGATASASCHGRNSYVPKVGNREPHSEPRQWTFQLQLQGDDWKIAKADVR